VSERVIADEPPQTGEPAGAVADLVPVLRSIVPARVTRQQDAEDLVHDTLLRVLAAKDRAQPRLLERPAARDDILTVPISTDPDIVAVRQAARDLAVRAGFSGADLTLLATAVSEVARNIVRFAGAGEVRVELLTPRRGVRVVARDAGPGIADVDAALAEGFSTSDGLGLGLPGSRRLMDEFELSSEVGRGTTITMTKWFDRDAGGMRERVTAPLQV
jgi:anti-sigma regulatory factor (Ser/Thr protein kinase)